MPARRGPGRPVNPWRPRKTQVEYEAIASQHHVPRTIEGTMRGLRLFDEYCRGIKVDSEEVTIDVFVSFPKWLAERYNGFTRTADFYNNRVRSAFLLKGSEHPGTKWAQLAAELKILKPPRVIGKKHPHKFLPLEVLPKILAASYLVKQHTNGRPDLRSDTYSEVPVVVATFLYSGGRVQLYGLLDDQVKAALQKKYVELFVKEGEEVYLPVHDKLLEIWARHLEERDFDGPMFFRHGRDSYTYQAGNTNWRQDARSAHSNETNVNRILHHRRTSEVARNADCVQRRLEEKYGIRPEDIGGVITAHRFRKSLTTYMEKYGLEPSELRLLLSHGAKTITEEYTLADIENTQRRLSQIDLGSLEWVASHNPPSHLFAGNGQDQDLVAQLRAQLQDERDRSDRLEKKLDQLLARSAPKVIA